MNIPYLLIIPIIVGGITQIIKFIVDGVRNKSWDIKVLKSYGGMPSGHAAFVVSLATIIGLDQGLASPAFAITVVFALIIIRDAVGLRMYLGRHGKTINRLTRLLPEDEQFRFPVLRERLGHNYSEATVGGIIGLALGYLFYLLLM
ncbi:divergent PAP2 family protein [Patescibacteria group bacterium]